MKNQMLLSLKLSQLSAKFPIKFCAEQYVLLITENNNIWFIRILILELPFSFLVAAGLLFVELVQVFFPKVNTQYLIFIYTTFFWKIT